MNFEVGISQLRIREKKKIGDLFAGFLKCDDPPLLCVRFTDILLGASGSFCSDILADFQFWLRLFDKFFYQLKMYVFSEEQVEIQ